MESAARYRTSGFKSPRVMQHQDSYSNYLRGGGGPSIIRSHLFGHSSSSSSSRSSSTTSLDDYQSPLSSIANSAKGDGSPPDCAVSSPGKPICPPTTTDFVRRAGSASRARRTSKSSRGLKVILPVPQLTSATSSVENVAKAVHRKPKKLKKTRPSKNEHVVTRRTAFMYRIPYVLRKKKYWTHLNRHRAQLVLQCGDSTEFAQSEDLVELKLIMPGQTYYDCQQQIVDDSMVGLTLSTQMYPNGVMSSGDVQRRGKPKLHSYDASRIEVHKSFVNTYLRPSPSISASSAIGRTGCLGFPMPSRQVSTDTTCSGDYYQQPVTPATSESSMSGNSFGDSLWLHVQAWRSGKPLSRRMIVDSLRLQQDYFYLRRQELSNVIDEIKSFEFQMPIVFDPLHQEHFSESFSMTSARTSVSGQLSSAHTIIPSLQPEPVVTSPPPGESKFTLGIEIDDLGVDVPVKGSAASTTDSGEPTTPNRQSNVVFGSTEPGHIAELEGTQYMFNDGFLKAQKVALKIVGGILYRYEKLQELYPHSKAMSKALCKDLDSRVYERIQVLYIWYNLSREFCRSIKQVGMMFGMHMSVQPIDDLRRNESSDVGRQDTGLSNDTDVNKELAVWPNLDYDSADESEFDLQQPSSMHRSYSASALFSTIKEGEAVGLRVPLTSQISCTTIQTFPDSLSSETCAHQAVPSSSDMKIRSTRALFQEYVEKAIRKKGMKRVLARIRHKLGRTILRGRQALMVDSERDTPSNENSNDRGDGCFTPKSTSSIIWPIHMSVFDREEFEEQQNAEQGQVVPDTVAEARRLMALALSQLDDPDSHKCGVHHVEFRAMNLPSLRPSYLFLLRIPVDVVHSWLRYRCEASFMDKNAQFTDMMTLKQLLRDGQDVLESAVEIRSFYHSQVREVVTTPDRLQSLLVTELSQFDNDLAMMFNAFLSHVKTWVLAWQEIVASEESQVAENQSCRGLASLEGYWRFAKRIGVHVKGGEADAAKHFGELAELMLERLMTFLAHAETEKTWTKNDVFANIPKGPRRGYDSGSDNVDTSDGDSDVSDQDSNGQDDLSSDEDPTLLEAVGAEKPIAQALSSTSSSSHATVQEAEDGNVTVEQPPDEPDDDTALFNVNVPKAMTLAERREFIFQVCRKLKILIIEARARSARALMFTKRLRSDLEASATFRSLVPMKLMLDRLAKTRHVALHFNFTTDQPVMVFVREELAEQQPQYIPLLLSVTCGRSLEDVPNLTCRYSYALWVHVDPDEQAELLDSWAGKTKRVMLDPSMTFSLQHLEVDDMKLLTLHPSILRVQRHAFLRLIGSDMLHVVDEQSSSHEIVARSMKHVKGTAMHIREQLINWLTTVEEFFVEEGQALEPSEKYVYKNAVSRAYDFVFEFHRALVKLLSGEWRQRLSDGLRQFAHRWIHYVLHNRESGKAVVPSWAYLGIKFLSLALEPKYTQYYSDEDFQLLKNDVEKCMAHLLGKNRVNLDDDGGLLLPILSMNTMRRSLSSSSTGSVDTHSARLPSQRARHKINTLERRREYNLRAEKRIGRVIERKDVAPAQRILKKKVNFKWQRLSKKLGEGTFGEVFTAHNLDTGVIMAVKQIPMESLRNHGSLRTIVDEITNFESIHHPNLVRYFGVEVHRDELLIFMEYCSEGTLEAVCKEGLSQELVRYYANAILLATYELHRRGIVHRDIKTANIFLTQDNVLKLGDFGCSVRIKDGAGIGQTVMSRTVQQTLGPGMELEKACGTVGTVPYMAPEILTSSATGYGKPADVWSIGCVVLEMITGKPPWQDMNIWQIIYLVGSGGTPPIPENGTPLCKHFLNLCLGHTPEKRPTIEQLMNHQFAAVKLVDLQT